MLPDPAAAPAPVLFGACLARVLHLSQTGRICATKLRVVAVRSVFSPSAVRGSNSFA